MISAVLPTLILTAPDVPGLYTLGGQVVGEVGGGQDRISLPVPPDGQIYLTFSPLQGQFAPVTRRLSFTGGMPDTSEPSYWQDVALTLWPGNLYEIRLIPRAFSANPTPQPPQTLGSAEHPSGVGFLYRETGRLLFIFEDQPGRIAHCEVLPEMLGAQLSCRDACGGTQDFVITGQDEGGLNRLCILSESAAWRPVLSVSAHEALLSAPGVVQLTDHIPDTLGHTIRRTLQWDGKYFEEVNRAVLLPQNRARPATLPETVSAFLDAVRLRQEQEAMSYLTPAMSEGLAFDSIVEFFGDFLTTTPPRYPVMALAAGQVMGLTSLIDENLPLLERVRLYDFEMAQEGPLIDNIREV